MEPGYPQLLWLPDSYPLQWISNKRLFKGANSTVHHNQYLTWILMLHFEIFESSWSYRDSYHKQYEYDYVDASISVHMLD
jgi:hypothetical protein